MVPIMTRPLALAAAAALLLFCAAAPAMAAESDPFADGSMRLSVLVGNGYAFDESYLIVGVGFGYFVAKGFELGLDAERWSGSTPHITKVSPEIRYVMPTDTSVRPYVGAFYRRTMIENYDDLDSLGGRAGVYFLTGRGSYFGAGGVYENYLSCDETVYQSCSDTYAEILFAISF